MRACVRVCVSARACVRVCVRAICVCVLGYVRAYTCLFVVYVHVRMSAHAYACVRVECIGMNVCVQLSITYTFSLCSLTVKNGDDNKSQSKEATLDNSNEKDEP